MKTDPFAKKMARIDKLAKEQGAKTKRERVMFQVGWTFGFAEIITQTQERIHGPSKKTMLKQFEDGIRAGRRGRC